MKRNILIAIAMVVFAITLHAQGIGLKAGMNLQNINGKLNGVSMKNQLMFTWNAGINYEIAVAPDMYLQPGALFAVKGAKNSDKTLRLNYIEIPVNFVYKPLLGSGKFILGFGPYFAYGVGGKNEWLTLTTTGSPFGKAPELKSIDAGANIFFGYAFKPGLELQFNAGLGLVDIDRFDGDTRHANTGFGLSLGYRF